MQIKHIATAAITGVALGIAACSGDSTTAVQANADLQPQVKAMLADGFTSSTAGFSQTNNSFVANSDAYAAWVPPGFIAGTTARQESDLMGGGLGADFAGDASAVLNLGGGDEQGDEDDRGPFEHFSSRRCTYSATDGRITCPTFTERGITITRSFAYTDVSGKAQAAFDTSTNAINTQITVKGTTISRHHDTTTVDEASNQTVSGLAKGSTKRFVNGTSGGTETTTGVADSGFKFVAMRVIGDTTTNLTVPVTNRRPGYPISGMVVRSMKVTVTRGTDAPVTSTRREVITYDGSATAKVDITENGTTKHCTRALPHGHLTCGS